MNPYIVLDIETTGLSPFKNQITCICAKQDEMVFKGHAKYFKDDKEKTFESERSLLVDFLNWLESEPEMGTFVGHAVETFDLPFILVRSIIHNLELPFGFNHDLKNSFDIKIESEFLREQGVWLSLNNLAKILGLPGQKTGNGLEAIKLFNEGKYDELVSYCWQDVLLTEQVYLKLMEKKGGC
jgi:uncharacterized protein YprB with RNaseH-like and TPR domain